MKLRPFVAIPESVRDWTRWHQDQKFPIDFITVILTTHTAAIEDAVLVDDDTAGGAVTVNLPLAAANGGKLYHIKKLGTTGSVTVDGNGSETIDGSLTFTLTAQYQAITIVTDGSNWHIL